MDVDIDLQTSFDPLKVFKWTKASVMKNEYLSPHPCGVYPQNVPIDPLTKLSAIPYEEAEELGYFKIDMLHVGIYDHFSSRAEIEELITIEPNWNLLLDKEIQPKLFQLGKHGDVLDEIRPKSILELSDVLAIIRPGKRELLKLYKSNPVKVRPLLYEKTEDAYSFKRSHSIAYAHVIVLQLHLFDAGVI